MVNANCFSGSEKTKPMARWWIPAALVSYEEIEKEIKEAWEAGFGGLELCVNMADSAPTKRDLAESGWATPRWNQLYKHILKTANSVGLQIDTTLTPAWPPAILGITPESKEASKELFLAACPIFTGCYNGLPPTEPVSSSAGFVGEAGGPGGPGGGPPPGEMEQTVTLPNKPELVAVIAAEVAGTVPVTKEQTINWGDMSMVSQRRCRETVLLKEASLRVLSTTDGELSFTAPNDGQWIIFAAWLRGTEQQNKQGRATETPCLVIDHFGGAGADALIEFWENNLLDDEIRALLRENGGSLFEDSMEVSVSGGCFHWSWDLLPRFQKSRGYDLTKFIPLLHGVTCGGMSNTDFYTYELADSCGQVSPVGDRIRRDFKQIITEGFAYEHVDRIQRWAAGLGLGFRCQCYSGLQDTALCSAVCTGPEGESLGFGPDAQGDDRFRIVSGGAHMNGRVEITDEVGALANKGYRLTWIYMLRWINKNYCGGANRMIFHGYPYAESSVSKWPGYSPFGFGLGGYWGSREPGWQHIGDFTAYLSRAQAVLHKGVPAMDFAVLSHKYGTLCPVLKDQTLSQLGYTYDIVTPNLLKLPKAVVSGGRLCPDGPSYGALVIDGEQTLPLETVKALLQFRRQGLPIIFCAGTPKEPSYYKDDPKEYADRVNELLKRSVVVAEESELPKALADVGLTPMFSGKRPVSVAARKDADSHYYCFWNNSDETVTLEAALAGEGHISEADPWDGGSYQVPASANGSRRLITLELAPQAFRIMVVGPQMGQSVPAALPDSVSIDSWTLTIDRYENAHDSARPARTKRTTVSIPETAGVPWDKLPGLPAEISGVGTYEAKFQWKHRPSGLLKLKKAYFCGVSVYVNGIKVPFDHYTATARLEGCLLQGENTLTIRLSSTLGNQLIADGDLAAPEWCPENKPIPESFGLMAPVEIFAVTGGI